MKRRYQIKPWNKPQDEISYLNGDKIKLILCAIAMGLCLIAKLEGWL
jgi:hypothetical protein